MTKIMEQMKRVNSIQFTQLMKYFQTLSWIIWNTSIKILIMLEMMTTMAARIRNPSSAVVLTAVCMMQVTLKELSHAFRILPLMRSVYYI